MYVHSGSIVSTRNGTQRNIKNLKKSESNQFKWYSSMIIKDIKLFSQNVWKNKFLTNNILESNKEFNIIFIQELPWSIIQSIPSSLSKKEDSLVDTPNHSD